MRLQSKYHYYHKLSLFFSKVNKNRILKFKHTKWKRLKSLLVKSITLKKIKKISDSRQNFFSRQLLNFNEKKKIAKIITSPIVKYKQKDATIKKNISKKLTKHRTKFITNEILRVKCKFWSRMRKYYKESLTLRNYLNFLFGCALTLPDYKKTFLQKKVLNRKNDFIQTFINPLFRIEILLWHLNFFLSSYDVKQKIKSKLVLVNNKIIPDNYLLKKGDIITISTKINSNYCFCSTQKTFFYSFLEVDYYTKTIIILTDPFSLECKDIALFYEHHTNPLKLGYYIKKK